MTSSAVDVAKCQQGNSWSELQAAFKTRKLTEMKV
jgi:hypothetical protein